MAKRNIAVVGCGTAGPAAALLMKQAGHAVTIYERFEEPAPVGAGFLLQPTGLRVLDRLGLADAARETGGEVARLVGHTVGGRLVMDLPYGHLGPSMTGLGIHRGALFMLLMNALNDAGIGVVSGTEIANIVQNDDGAHLIGRDGPEIGPFDLVVVASGAMTALRKTSGLVRRDRPYGWGAVWTICEDRDNRFAGALHQVYDRAHKMAGVLPVGRLPGAADSTPLVSLFWSIHAEDYQEWETRGLEAWKDEFSRYWPEASGLLSSIQSIGQFNRAAYRDAILRPWHKGRVVYIGDAAHSMSPQLGQGANLALLDAAALACAFEHHTDISQALTEYSQRRLRQVKYYQWLSRWLTPVFQSRSRPLAVVRDLTMPWFCKFPITRGMMLKTMAGLSTGLFSTIDLTDV